MALQHDMNENGNLGQLCITIQWKIRSYWEHIQTKVLIWNRLILCLCWHIINYMPTKGQQNGYYPRKWRTIEIITFGYTAPIIQQDSIKIPNKPKWTQQITRKCCIENRTKHKAVLCIEIVGENEQSMRHSVMIGVTIDRFHVTVTRRKYSCLFYSIPALTPHFCATK